MTVLFGATLGIVAALTAVARGRSSEHGNVVIFTGVLVAAAWVLLRALRVIFTIRAGSARPSVRGCATQKPPVIWTVRWDGDDRGRALPWSSSVLWLSSMSTSRKARGKATGGISRG